MSTASLMIDLNNNNTIAPNKTIINAILSKRITSKEYKIKISHIAGLEESIRSYVHPECFKDFDLSNIECDILQENQNLCIGDVIMPTFERTPTMIISRNNRRILGCDWKLTLSPIPLHKRHPVVVLRFKDIGMLNIFCQIAKITSNVNNANTMRKKLKETFGDDVQTALLKVT